MDYLISWFGSVIALTTATYLSYTTSQNVGLSTVVHSVLCDPSNSVGLSFVVASGYDSPGVGWLCPAVVICCVVTGIIIFFFCCFVPVKWSHRPIQICRPPAPSIWCLSDAFGPCIASTCPISFKWLEARGQFSPLVPRVHS